MEVEATLRPWCPAIAGIREVLHADFPAGSHAYPMHAHDTWTLLLVDQGAIRYRLDRREHLAQGASVTLLPPHVPHDGCSATEDGFRKRVVYLEPDAIGAGVRDAAVRSPTSLAPALRAQVSALHADLSAPEDPLAAETRLVVLLSQLQARWTGGPADPAPALDRVAADRAGQLRDLIDARVGPGLSLQEAADVLGISRSGLVHAFRRRFEMTPHRYLVSRRLDLARTLLLEGCPAAEAAVRSGFHDQAHLTRHFKRLLGVPPGAWAAAAR